MLATLRLRILRLDLDRHELRLLFAHAAQQIARCRDADQPKHDGHADHQVRIHELSSFSGCEVPNGGESCACGESGSA